MLFRRAVEGCVEEGGCNGGKADGAGEEGRAIGANIEEADGADTAKDRVYKWTLSRKEAREARYWNRVIRAANADSEEGRILEQECSELVNILSALINKGKHSLNES